MLLLISLLLELAVNCLPWSRPSVVPMSLSLLLRAGTSAGCPRGVSRSCR